MLFCGERDYEGEKKILRHSMIVDKLQELYTDVYQDWVSGHEKFAEEFRIAMKALKKFVELSRQHSPYLLRKAQRIEEYLSQR